MSRSIAPRPFAPADALRLRFVEGAGLVPGGPWGWYVVLAADAGCGADRRSLWLFDRGDPERPHRQVAGALADPRSAAPSPDGARLAFAAGVDGVAQLCCLTLADGVVEILTALPQGVGGAPAWSPAGDAIAFAAPPRPCRDPSEPYRVDRVTIRCDGIGAIDDALQEVHVLDIATRAVRRLTDDRAIAEDPRFSPDGARVLYRSSFAPDAEWTGAPSLHVIDVPSGECRKLVGAWGGVLAAEWCLGGEAIALCGTPRTGEVGDAFQRKLDVWTIDAAGGTPVCRTERLVAGVGNWLELDHPTWATDRVPRLRVDASGAVAHVSAQRGRDLGIERVALAGEEHVEAVVPAAGRVCFLRDADPADGTLAYVATTPLDPPELFLHDGGERRVTWLNDGLMEGVTRPRATPLEIVAPDGIRIEGTALTPPGEGPFPTVLCVHGGPGQAHGSAFMIDWQLLAGAGFAVVSGNFRGSGGYGDDFHGALDGRWGELGEPDHLATVDRAVELGIADPQRLGVYGLSHGGFAVCWLLGRTDRFRAGVAENPVVDFASAYATMDAPWWVPVVFAATPAEDPARYAERSALTYAQGCTAPLLLVVGEDDRRCHPTQAEQLYRVLKRTGCTTEMLRLPGAGHVGSWSGPARVRAAQDAALVEWLSRHLGPPGDGGRLACASRSGPTITA